MYRTDIRGYYRHILKLQVGSQLRWHVQDPVCRGSALSPLIGGSLLRYVDHYFATREELFYARYMDDFIIFTKTRWYLRKAIKRLHEFFDQEGFETHPDKTQLGRLE